MGTGDTFADHADKVADIGTAMTEQTKAITDAGKNDYLAFHAALPYADGGRFSEEIKPDAVVQDSFLESNYRYVRFRAELAELTGELDTFADSADLGAFDEIVVRLYEAVDVLELAVVDEIRDDVRDAMGAWAGTAGVRFKRSVITPFSMTLWFQAKLAEEIARAVWHYKKLIERGRGDALGLAEQLRAKIRHEGDEFSLGGVLWVVGTVMAGFATFGASIPASAVPLAWASRGAFVAGQANNVLHRVEKLEQVGEPDWPLEGDIAEEYFDSCWLHIAEIKRQIFLVAHGVLTALRLDLNESLDELSVIKPGAPHPSELSDIGGSMNVPIDQLRYAGRTALPQMASYLGAAHDKVAGLGEVFGRAIGDACVATSLSPTPVTEAISELANAFRNGQEFLLEAGAALVEVADRYQRAEDDNEAAMNAIAGQLPH